MSILGNKKKPDNKETLNETIFLLFNNYYLLITTSTIKYSPDTAYLSKINPRKFYSVMKL